MWRWPGARDIMSVDAHAGTPGPAPAARSTPHPRQSPSLFSGDRDKTRCGVWRGRRAACLNVSISRLSEQCGNTRHSSTSFCSTLFLSSVSPAPNNHSTQCSTQGPVLVLVVILGRGLQSRIGQTGPRWDQAHILYPPVHSLIGNINMEHLARSQATHCTGCWLPLLLRGNILEILPSLRTLACSVSLSHLKMPLKW